jgi:hypothetical protein
MSPPSEAIMAAMISDPVIGVNTRATIFESDGITPFIEHADVTAGNITVDWNRDERRTLDITLKPSRSMRYNGSVGYDKMIKVWYSVDTTAGSWETSLGEFYIDTFDEESFPSVLAMTCRDATKKLLKGKFTRTTTFRSGQKIEDVIRGIAVSGGISKMNLPVTGKNTTRDHTFDAGTARWPAIKEIAGAYGYEIYFDVEGYLTMELMQDPLLTPSLFTFQTGPRVGNLTHFKRRSTDDRLYNHIIVRGEGTTPPLYAEAFVEDGPTGVNTIGWRSYEFVSQFFTTEAQCQETADKFLAIHALEDYEVQLESRIFAWLEPGRVVDFIDPDPDPGAPSRYMHSAATIPLRMGKMGSTVKRVVSLV